MSLLAIVIPQRLKRLLASKRFWALALFLAAVGSYPFWGGTLAGRLVASKISKRVGLPVRFVSARTGFGGLTIRGLQVGDDDARLVVVPLVRIPYAVAWGSGTVLISDPKIELRYHGKQDNLSALIGKPPKSLVRVGAVVDTTRSYPALEMKGGTLSFVDASSEVTVTVEQLDALVEPKRRFRVSLGKVEGTWGKVGEEPAFGAESIVAEGALEGMRPSSLVELAVKEGHVLPLPTLPLTGITGSLRPSTNGETIDILFSGSYRGAKQSLWTATGKLKQPIERANLDGELSLRAERFSLDKIAEVLPPSILEPANTEIDAAITIKLSGKQASANGKLDVARLSFNLEKLAAEPVQDASFQVRFDATVDRDKRRLDLTELEGKIGSLVVRLAGNLELPPGKFQFKTGRTLNYLPRLEFNLRVPRTPCAKILASIPAPLVPKLQGFALQGFFDADVHLNVDFENLDALELGGKVGIDGCQVTRAPVEILSLTGPESIQQTVEVPPPPGGGTTNELLSFFIGPDNPDFVPYEKISPYLVSAILTTEDSGFFRHRGWVSPEFKTALKRNIVGGGFRLGASSITMQTVKNVILGREKTLSRKFQELFLVWYIEQLLPKERILELYFNAIEFGPRLYGIGPAVRHYFGKVPADLTPLEAAFFSSILPSPKRRYVQYCHGSLTPQWERYVRRIVTKMRERGRLNEDEFATAMASTMVFDKGEMTMTEKQCNDWVKKITTLPETEPEPDGQ